MNDELNVLPTEDVNVESLPAEASNTNTLRNVALIAGGLTIAGALGFAIYKVVKKHIANKKAQAEAETVVESKTE